MDLLEGRSFRVASYGPAAAYAGWLLRQLGARVEHVTALDPEGLGAFLGEGASHDGAPSLEAAPRSLLLTDAPVTDANRHALERASVAARAIWITPWGSSGDMASQPASDLVLHAAGGWLSAVGDPGREPVGPPGALGQFVAGLFAAIAAIAPDQPPAGLVDIPIIEGIVATLIYDPVAFQYLGAIRARAGNRFAPTQPTLVTIPVKDGYIGLHAALHGQWLSLCRVTGHPEIPADPRFAAMLDRIANIPALEEQLFPWFAQRTRWEVFHELHANRVPNSAHPDMAEVLDSPQLRARNSWNRVRTPSGRDYKVPGSPVRVNAVAPERSGFSPAAGPWREGAIRVVDFSMGWAGPLAAMLLASLGADVIKVESHTHYDWWRGSRPVDDPALQLHERSHVFNSTNRGKRGITLNLQSTRGVELAAELIAGADVVIENYGAGVMEKLGLGYDRLSAENPGLVMLRQPGFGSSGPESGYLTFGNTIEGMSGLTALMGYPDGPPLMMSNAAGDPVSGLNGTLAVLAGLAARKRDGRGRLLECAQLEGFLPLVSEGLIEYQRTGEIPPRRGNQRPGHAFSGVFRCSGDDDWVAIDAVTADQARALAGAVGSPRAIPTHDEVSAFTASVGKDDVAARCAAAGIPAAPVANEAEVLYAEPLASNGFWQTVEREIVGTYLYPGVPISSGEERPLAERPAPLLGEHNVEVFAALGLDAAALDALRAENVIGETPG